MREAECMRTFRPKFLPSSSCKMVHHVTKIEEVTFMVHEIAILKHPKTLLTKEDWEKYRKLASSYVHHRDKVFLVVRRFDEWRNHSYTRDYESERTLYNPSVGSERYKEGDFIVHEEIEPAMGEDEEENYGELNDYERETIELEKEVANLEHPSARIELQLVWGQSIRESQDQDCTETQITSPYILKLNDFIQRNITCMTAGEVAFEIEHTDREVELSFRNPLRGPEVSNLWSLSLRKDRIYSPT